MTRRSALDFVLVAGAWLLALIVAANAKTRVVACAVSAFSAAPDTVVRCADSARWLALIVAALVAAGIVIVKLVDYVRGDIDSRAKAAAAPPPDAVAAVARAVLLVVAALWGGDAGAAHLLSLRAAVDVATTWAVAYELVRPLLGALVVALFASALVDEWRERRELGVGGVGEATRSPRQ